MTKPPATIRIYHITHIWNLDAILSCGGLLSDAEMIKRGGPQIAVGMSAIKQRRLRLPVACYSDGDVVGDYVPFYLCPRSIMLYLLHMGNHSELTYRGGQGPIIHLQADLKAAAEWADQSGGGWAFSLANAGANYTPFRKDLDDLDQIDWTAVASNDFRSPSVKEGKQAEFLVRRFFPWESVERVGVCSQAMQEKVREALAEAAHRPPVDVLDDWYF